ncbi:MAG: hypothetical protein J4F46_04805, partial [Dehalococcoidia bacterium]|nr:hypothetical protein [Dehalococcoidia bacterium]
GPVYRHIRYTVAFLIYYGRHFPSLNGGMALLIAQRPGNPGIVFQSGQKQGQVNAVLPVFDDTLFATFL